MIETPFIAYIFILVSWVFYWKNELKEYGKKDHSATICLVSGILALIVGGWGVVFISLMFLVALHLVCVAMLPITKHLSKRL